MTSADRVIVKRYRLDEEIGREGQDPIWRATDQLLDRRVAMKQIWSCVSHAGTDAGARQRRIREARAAAGLHHPNIVPPDEPPTHLAPAPAGGGMVVYPRGTLAMVKAAAPNTGGSQFFFVYGDSTLMPEYTVFGTVAPEGMATLDAIAQAGTDASIGPEDGAPVAPVVIRAATAG